MDWTEYSRSVMQKCKQNEIPFYACFELTPFCNFACNMCYIRLTPNQAKKQGVLLSTKQWIQLAEEAKKMGTMSLEITGGEAVIRDDFPILYKAFIELGYLINLRSNGYLLKGNVLNILTEYKPRRIGITLYGASNETYYKICGVKDGFSLVTHNILALKDAGFTLRLTMTVTKDNYQEVNVLKAWASEHGLEIHPYAGLFTPIRGAKRSIDHLRVDYFNKEIEESLCDQPIGYRQIEDRSVYMNPFWMCNGFGAMFCISWDGRMTLCNSMTAVWKDPFAQGLENAYHSLYKDLRNIKRPKECENCQYIDYCGACPTRFLSETGRFDCISEKICAKTRFIYSKKMNK